MEKGKIGKKYSKLTILYNIEDGNSRAEVVCKCECGNEIRVKLNSLKTSNTKSCGCSHKEQKNTHFVTHGLTKHPLFHVWYQMISRCTKPNHPDYHNYGGRGITVCEEWKDEPKRYIEDIEKYLGKKPSKGHTIDRVDNDKGYYIDNMRGSSRTEQNINRRSKSKIGLKNIQQLPSGKYRVMLRREGTVRCSKALIDIKEIISIRDTWIEEYKKDNKLYIERTVREDY